MPELPEVEFARTVLEGALDREIRSLDDNDDWVCRPHPPGQTAQALVGGRLTAAHRRGRTMWCETSAGPDLGIHLGMGGQINVDGRVGPTGPEHRNPGPRKPEWDRFTVHFVDGGSLRLFDKRRLGRVRLDPDVDALGPDAEMISREDFRSRVGRGHSAAARWCTARSAAARPGGAAASNARTSAGAVP